MCGEKIIVFVSYFNPCEPNVRQEASEDHLFFYERTLLWSQLVRLECFFEVATLENRLQVPGKE